MRKKKRRYFGNHPNSPGYDPGLPIGYNQWDDADWDDEPERDEKINDQDIDESILRNYIRPDEEENNQP